MIFTDAGLGGSATLSVVKQRHRVLIKVHGRLGLLPQGRSRAGSSDGSLQCRLDRCGLTSLGTQTYDLLCQAEGGDREREGVWRYRFQTFKVTFIHLLHLACVIELDQFDQVGILKIRHGGIIERNVPVLSYTETTQINRCLLEKVGVTFAFIERKGSIPIQVVKVLRLNQTLYPLPHVQPETGLVVCRNTKILVHVKKRDLGPVNSPQFNQCFEELYLGVPGGKNGPDRAVQGKPLDQVCPHSMGRIQGHVRL